MSAVQDDDRARTQCRRQLGTMKVKKDDSGILFDVSPWSQLMNTGGPPCPPDFNVKCNQSNAKAVSNVVSLAQACSL